MQPFFGYPGGKSKTAKKIFNTLNLSQFGGIRQFVEPFSGGFSMGLYCTPELGTKAWINDFDRDLYCLWVAVIDHTEQFCDAIQSAKISPELFYTLRTKLLTERPFSVEQIVPRALDKLIIHKISFSNLGEKSGSPVGGKNQTGSWKYDCRWKPDLICGKIRKVAAALEDARITCKTYSRILKTKSQKILMYVDPPYVEAGAKCYKHSFTENDHIELASLLAEADYPWFVTYDYHSMIQDLYQGFNFYDFELKYSMSSCSQSTNKVRVAKELLIANF